MTAPLAAPPAAILCGGRGTRLHEGSEELPTPLVEVGPHPILWHVMRTFLAQEVTRFVLLAGEGKPAIETFLASEDWPAAAEVLCLDTGASTPTGGRIAKAAEHLQTGPFFVAYADCVADLDLGRLLAFHRDHGRLATMTVVRPRLPFGVAELDGDGFISGFREKPRSARWINGGYFCFQPGVLDLLHDSSSLEREPLDRLIQTAELHAYRHEGFLMPMDTYKDTLVLNDLWNQGAAPWKLWR